jgi:membrane-bound lytic murein transglycosylase B
MSQKLTTWQKATALVPLALLSGAWTTSLTVTSSASATTQETTVLPDGTEVPDQALEAPASMSRPGSIAPGVPAGAADSVVASSSANGIPAAALAAYQRAEQVINSADAACNLSWQLIAAIGRVESDHGRYGGNVLGDDGKSRPGIYGIALDGSNGTAEIRDTDGGRFDNDQVWDRAVGPMQFIPQTWEIVGVDGDGDGKRDPQDIDDAALATAVYLCSGDEDLSTYGGQKAAVYRYNHSREYVDLVISIMNAYLEGDFSSVPNGVATSTVFTPTQGGATVTPAKSGKRKQTREGATQRDGRSGSGTRTGTGSGSGGGGTTTPEVPQEQPGDDSTKSLTDTTKETVKKTTDTVEDTTKKVTDSVDNATGGTLSKAEATAKCLAKGLLAGTAAFDACVAELTK